MALVIIWVILILLIEEGSFFWLMNCYLMPYTLVKERVVSGLSRPVNEPRIDQ